LLTNQKHVPKQCFPIPTGGTPTLRVFFVSLIKHTWFNSSAP